jgi:exonuclease SbcD
MKILVTGDWHLGKIVDNYSMLDDQTHILKQIRQQVIDNKISLLIITGDIYDRAIAPKEAVHLFDSFISDMINNLKIKVIIISGNHDSYQRLSFGSSIFESQGFYIGKEFDGRVDHVVLEDDFGPLYFHLIPYAPYQEIRAVLDDKEITSFHMAYKKMIDTIDFVKDARHILVTHAYVVSNTSNPETSESEKTLSIGGMDYVDASLFEAFDFVALGHIHKAQKIGRDANRYSGSILKYSFSEVNHKKSTMLLNCSDMITTESLPLIPLKDFVVINDYFDQIISDKERIKECKNQYVKIILKDKTEIIDVVAKLRVHFNYIMEFTYENARNTSIEKSLMTSDLATKISNTSSVDYEDVVIDLFKEFATNTYDYELSKDEEELLIETSQNVLLRERDK